MHCIQNNETDCNIRHLFYSPLFLRSSLLCWHCARAVRDRASVGGLRNYSYGFLYLSMPNLLHFPPKLQLSLPSEKSVLLLCTEKKRYIGFAWTSPAHRHSDFFPHLGGHHPVCLVGVGTPVYTSTLRHGIYYLPRSNFTVAVSTKSQKKLTRPQPGNPAAKTQDILHQFLDIRS